MDVRQLAFLARQPSAALQPRDTFWGLSKRGLAFILANMMFWQPLVAMADGIVVNGSGTTLGQAGNGVPIVNIATPNGSGLSHNKFSDYNVGQQGLILNNATGRTQETQLGGIILGNSNLGGRAANVILNEVNGGSPSQLKGYTEVAGQAAHVIVANPYGVSCNGCGFINTPKATLTTGKPVIENGQLQRYQVDQGSVAIEGAGLNASNIDQFEIITRSAKINAEIQARHLAVIAGANDVDAKTLNATARTANPADAPQLAIDSSALGGMYAGAIKLVGTEAGVGVKLDGKLIASGGDIQLDANGQLRMAEASAEKGAVAIKAQSLEAQGAVYAGTDLKVQTQDDLNNHSTLAAANSINLGSGGQLNNQGIIEAGVNLDNSRNPNGDVTLTAQNLNNSGKSVVASRDLTVTTTQTLNNQGGTLSGQRQVTVKAGILDNQNKGRVLSSANTDLAVSQLMNAQGGLINSRTNLSAQVGQLDNHGGELSSLDNLSLQVATLDNVAGLASAGRHLSLTATGAINNRGGQLVSLQTLDLKAGQVDNSNAGRIASNQALTASVTGLDQHDGGRLTSVTSLALDLNQGHLNNQGGLINGPRLTLKNLDSVDNRRGEISSAQAFTLMARSLDNSHGKLLGNQALTLRLDQALSNIGGLISARGLDIGAATLDNHDGIVTSRGDLALSLSGSANNHGGELSSLGATTLKGTSLDNRDGQVGGDQALDIDLSAALNNQKGVLGAGKNLHLKAASLDNSHQGSLVSDDRLTARIDGLLDNGQQGDISAKGAIDLQAARLDNRAGKVRADQALKLEIGRLDNRQQGLLSSLAALNFNGSHLDNRGGLLSAAGPVRLDATSLDNSGGRLSSKSGLLARVSQLTNQRGELVAQGDMSLNGVTLDNRDGGLVGSTKALTLEVAEVDNRGGEISSSEGLSLQGTRLDNSDSGKLLAGTDLGLKVAQVINQNRGLLFGKGRVAVDGQSLDNHLGRLVAQQGLAIRLDNALSNQQGLISSEGLLAAQVGSLDNSGGKLSSAAALTLTSAGALLNRNASITTDGELGITSHSLDNSQGGLLSSKGAARVGTGAFDNTQGAQLISGDSLDLKAAQVSNGQGSRIASEKALTASLSGLDQQGGELFSKSALTLDLNQGQLTNHQGLINAPLLVLKNLADVNNQGGEISSAQAFTLAAGNLDNSSGKLISQQGLTLRIEQALSNLKGLVSAKTLDLRSHRLDNSEGLISSLGAQTLRVDGQLANQQGTVIADEQLSLTVGALDNSQGQISGKADVQAKVAALNNQGGQLMAAQRLELVADSLDNRQGGLVGATQGLALKIGAVDNRGGELSSKADVSLDGTRLANSEGGKVLAEGALELTVAQVINRSQGLLSGKAGLTLSGDSLDNHGGALLTEQQLKAELLGLLDNRQGLISAEGRLGLKSAELDNSGGSVSSAGALTLEHGGALLNQGGVIVTDGALLLNSARLDNRNQGNISAKATASVRTGALDNSHKGRLSGGDSLTLSSAQLTNQDGGRIASDGALSASVSGLDQQGGQLFSNTALSLDLNHGQLNNQQGLINAPLLMLKNLKEVNNQGGEISSAQAFSLAAERLDNSQGKVLSNQALTLRIDQALGNLKGMIAAASLDIRAASLDNSGATLTSRGALDLQLAGALNNSQQGLINAADRLTIGSSALDNQGGSLLGSAIAVDLGSATGDLNNSAGLISTDGSLTIAHLRDLNNRNGEVSSRQGLDLTARTLDNSAGKLISNDQLNLKARELLNQGGLVSGWQGLSANLGSLDNRNLGTLSSRSGGVEVQVGGDLQNSGAGALVSQKALRVTAANLDNSGGILSSAGEQTLDVSGLLDNAQGGLIDSGAALTVQAMTLGNAGGGISAQQALSLRATSLDNRNGSLKGNAAVTLSLLGALANSGGKLASGGPLRIERAGQIDNQGGQIASQGLMTLLGSGLDNRNRGTVAANDQLTLTVDGTLHNSGDGLIYSQNGDLHVQAASLANAKGTLQSQGALNLSTGDLDNQSGRILAKNDDLNIGAGNLDNRGGILSSLQGAMVADLRGVLKNGYDLNNNRQGGVTQAQRLSLKALAGIDNYGGRISAQTGDALITTGDFDNRNGGLYAKGLVQVSGGNFDNSGDNDGQIAGQRIDLDLRGALNNRLGIIESDSSLSIKAASLDNQTGQLRALGSGGSTRFEIGGQFDNRNGTLESANSDLSLGVGHFLNGGGSLLHVGRGTFDISTGNVTGAGGSIVTRGGLALNADSWNNSSVIQAGRLTVNVNNFSQSASGQLLASDAFIGSGGNWSNEGLIASDGSLNLNLSGTYSGNGRLSSRGTLALGAAQVNLDAPSSLAGGGDTRISVAGQLNNAGRLTSGAQLNLSAGGVNNQGTLGAAQGLTLTTGALLNDHGLLFSGGDMGLRVDSLTNSYADVYSLGNLTVDRDGQGTLASRIVNSSGSLQSDGSMGLAASTIENVRAVLKTDNQGIYTARIGEIGCIEGVNAGDCSGKRNHVWEIVQRDKFEVTEASAASSITSGAHLNIKGGDLLNQSSTIAAAGDLVATVNNLTNSGVETGETETTRVFMSARAKNAGSWYNVANAFTNKYWFQSGGYTPNDLGGLQGAMAGFIGMTEREWVHLGSTRKLAGGDQSYAAVMQAGGAVSINAGNGINNSVVRPGYTYVGSGARINTDAPGGAFSTRVTLNQQLPPDLAQQQVNPLALPGFSLPSGQNGLFRLSGQGGSTPTTTGPQTWTLGGATLNTAQRQQALPVAQVQDIRIADAQQIASRSGDLSTNHRQIVNIGTDASAINAALPGAGTTPGPVLPGRAAVDDGISQPMALNGQPTAPIRIERVQGLPDSSVRSNPHKYLIETNPALTDLKQFMSSDYLLSNLGYNPDESAKRLGDGFYEQKLIQQAVVARTGQRYLAGQDTDEKLFKYLMDNAIKSKDRLNLAVGVTLTSEQVAALTHDIVWLENAEVNGEQVLVPVLYLAHSDNRLAPNGALIAGNDVNLIAGQDLNNVGTLRATHNLSAQAGQNLVNSGLVEAGNRLDLLAGNNLVNKAGGIIAGRDVTLTATRGDVINERTLSSHQSSNGSYAQQRDFVDSAARVEAANNLVINAGRDVNNNGGVLTSGADTSLKAGRDVNLTSVEQVVSNDRGVRYNDLSVTQNGSSLQAGRDLAISVGRDISAIASQIEAKRDVAMTATANLSLVSAANEQHSYSKTKKVTSQEDHVQQVGTTLVAGGNVALKAGEDLALTASRVTAGDEAYLYAGGDVNLSAGQNSDYSYYRKTKTSSSGLSSSQKTRIDSSNSVTQQGSSVSGDTVVIRAGQDIGATASDIVSTHSTSLVAGRNVEIDSATETYEQSHSTAKKKSGLLSSGGIGFTLGSTSAQNTSSSTTENAKASTIGSVLGNVDIQAGKDLTLKGSDVIAGKDISLVGQNVNILAAENHNKSEQTSKTKTSGLTLALSGTVGSAVDAAYQTTKQAKEEDDSRLSALQGIKAGLTGVQAWQAAQQGGGMNGDNIGQFVGISISLGSQQSSSKQTQEQVVSQGSSLTSGNNLSIVAAGGGTAGADGDIRVQGSQLKAGNNVLLAAERDIQLEAAANRQKLDGKNSSSGGAIGVSLGVGPNGAGLSIFANGNKGVGKEKGTGTTWTETTLDAGNQASLISGRDAALKGAQVNADKITAKVGRDLTLQSLQDTDDYKSKQSNVSGGASFTFGTMTGSASVSVSQSKIDSKYQSVQEQTGLFAGKGGYQVEVGKHTQLDGSVIASTAEADKNRLSTGTLGWSDLKNEAEYKSQMQSASVSSGNGGADGFTSNMPSGMLIAYNHGGSASGTTSSAISNGTLDIRDPGQQKQDVATLSRDVEHANGSISPIFDKEKEQKRLREVQLIGEIGTQVTDIVRTEGQLKADQEASKELEEKGIRRPGKNASKEEVENYQKQLIATDAYKQVMGKYGTGGDYQRVAQAVTAALQGLAGGDIGSALAGASAPYLAQLIKKTTGDNAALNTMAHAVLGAAVAQAQGNSAIAGAAGAAGGELAARLITQQLYGTSDTNTLSEEQKQTVAALSTLAAGLAGGIAKGDSAGAIAGAGAGKNAAENNHLGTGVNVFGHQLGKDQVAEFGNELKASCGDSGGLQACLKTYETWKETSYRQGGLETKEAQAGWEEFVQAVYTEKVLPLCKGNAACERNVATHMAVTTVTYAGDSVGIGQAIGEATRAVNLANGNWVRAGLQVLEDASLLATLGSMVGVLAKAGSAGAAKGTGGSIDRATTGIEWGKGIQGQGMPWENYLASQLPAGSRLPPNFKTFDFFDRTTGTAISAKTLDTATAAKIANPSQIYSTLKGNIDSAAKFDSYTLSNFPLSSGMISSRELRVAVPSGTTSAQWSQINKAIEYGQSQGVKVIVSPIK